MKIKRNERLRAVGFVPEGATRRHGDRNLLYSFLFLHISIAASHLYSVVVLLYSVLLPLLFIHSAVILAVVERASCNLRRSRY